MPKLLLRQPRSFCPTLLKILGAQAFKQAVEPFVHACTHNLIFEFVELRRQMPICLGRDGGIEVEKQLIFHIDFM